MKFITFFLIIGFSLSSLAANKIQADEAKALFESGAYCKTWNSQTYINDSNSGPSVITRIEIRTNGLNVCYHEYEKEGADITGLYNINLAYVKAHQALMRAWNADYYCFTYPSESSQPTCED